MREAFMLAVGLVAIALWLPILICLAASFVTLDPLWVLHTSIQARATLVATGVFGFIISAWTIGS